MKNKGFTLIELLGVFVILSILFLVVTPTVSNIISNSKEKSLDRNVDTILNGTKDWITENSKYLPNKGSKVNITLSQLKQLGYVENNIINPKTGNLFSNNMIITIENIGNNIPNDNEKYVKYSGDYKFSLEIIDSIDNSEYNENAPIININGDVVYFLEMDVENTGTYIDPGVSAYTKSGVDITSSVSVNKRKSDVGVISIDNTKLGVYYIDYTANDSSYSTTVTRTVIVIDTLAPSIIFDENITNDISTATTSFNVMDGVSCVDNSGVCNITTSGSVTLGVPGKNVIKYTVVDASGNTSTIKRIITIK